MMRNPAMVGRTCVLIVLGAALALAACRPGPSASSDKSASGPDATAVLERKTAFLEDLLARRALAADTLDALAARFPDRVWLTEVVFGSETVRVKGVAGTNNLLADYIARLSEGPPLSGLTLGGSVLKAAGGREWVEFTIDASVRAGPTSPPGPGAAPLPRPESAETLRALQRPALDLGLQLVRLAPGPEVLGEFAVAQHFAVEVQGDRADAARYLRALAELPGLWIVEGFTLRTVSPQDARSDVRASVAVRLFSLP